MADSWWWFLRFLDVCQGYVPICEEYVVDCICPSEQEEALACSVHRFLLAEVLVHVGRPGGASIDVRSLSLVHLPPVVRGAPAVFSAS